MSKQHVILIEDEVAIADTVTFAFEQEGFTITHHTLGRDGLADLRENNADVVILDVGLPDMNGMDVCKEIRTTSSVPIIFLTARGSEIDRIVGLEIGGDDYVTKPFSPREVVARARAILRRTGGQPVECVPSERCGLFLVNDEQGSVQYCDTELTLTRHEFLILTTLLTQPGRIFSRAQIMEAAWESPDTSLERAVDTHIKSLRAKLRDVDPDFDPIITKRGFGYSIQVNK